MAIYDQLFPAGATVTYTDDADFYYALLNDIYFRRIWDIIGLVMAGGLAILAYGGYQFAVESYKTIVSQE